MKNIFVLAAISGFIATGAIAQNTAFDNQDRTADAVENLEDQIEDDAERDLVAFGTEGREVGSYGSLSLRATSTSDDDTTSSDIGVGLRYGTFDGVNGFDTTASFIFSEDDGEETENQLLAGADYRRNFGDAFFGFAKADLFFDRLAEDAGETTQDIFVGAGVGYRIFNEADLQWSVQAGPGYRLIDVVGQERVEEGAVAVSSNVFYSLSETSYLTNDTDIITSDFSTNVTNEAALNVSLTDAMVLRTSLATVYDDAEDEDFGDAKNTLGVSVVYNFN
jgi:putative salt-induced outer membrane protein